ncbi:hypothetical protein ACHAXR_010440 [Thalassiosira sp. AJA248-18]
MKSATLTPPTLLFLLYLVQHSHHVHSQRPQTCTGPFLRFPAPSQGRCLTSWFGQRGEEKTYPGDFIENGEVILNKVQIFQCPSRGKRVIISNGIPNHGVILQNRNGPCEINWVVEMPLNPTVASEEERTEIPIRGMIAMAMNGVPAFGPQESDSNNAVEGTMGVPGARFWYGHAGPNSAWHTHNPKMGREVESHETLLGYAMDGFPIYGHLDDDSVLDLDQCNGIYKDGKYQYHVRALEQVDDNLEYCNGNKPETNWNYILGCYSGSVQDTQIFDSTSYSLDGDCCLDGKSDATKADAQTLTTEIPAAQDKSSDGNMKDKRPNIILMQPDDMPFFDAWSRPPNNPDDPNQIKPLPNYGLPHIESLRMNGMQLMQAYTASPMCGTSRFATITSRYPSRAASNDGDSPSRVVIPTTKLEGDDCLKNNIAVQFRDNGYRTAMIGKWHLSYIDKGTYTYDSAVNTVKACGFDSVQGLYIENLASGDRLNNYSDGSFSHNMEWLTHSAIKVIEETSNEPFFMYFNPTVPHGSNSVSSALRDFSCKDTPAGTLDAEPIIPGMTNDGGCASYRETIFARAEEDDDLGMIWIDDSVGALLRSLENMGILDNTIFLFQADHGMMPKNSLYEGSLRIPQFIHYPDMINAGTQFNAPVSVIDVGATMFDFAGISPSYDIDGQSWKEAISGEDSNTEDNFEDRCLYFENERDRAVRCGCFKHLSIFDQSSVTWIRGYRKQLSNDNLNLFDLCGGSDNYITEINGDNMEATNLIAREPNTASYFETLRDCHLQRIESGDFSPCQDNSEISASQLRTLNVFSLMSLIVVMVLNPLH